MTELETYADMRRAFIAEAVLSLDHAAESIVHVQDWGGGILGQVLNHVETDGKPQANTPRTHAGTAPRVPRWIRIVA
jgi:hypothetical protein